MNTTPLQLSDPTAANTIPADPPAASADRGSPVMHVAAGKTLAERLRYLQRASSPARVESLAEVWARAMGITCVELRTLMGQRAASDS